MVPSSLYLSLSLSPPYVGGTWLARSMLRRVHRREKKRVERGGDLSGREAQRLNPPPPPTALFTRPAGGLTVLSGSTSISKAMRAKSVRQHLGKGSFLATVASPLGANGCAPPTAPRSAFCSSLPRPPIPRVLDCARKPQLKTRGIVSERTSIRAGFTHRQPHESPERRSRSTELDGRRPLGTPALCPAGSLTRN